MTIMRATKVLRAMGALAVLRLIAPLGAEIGSAAGGAGTTMSEPTLARSIGVKIRTTDVIFISVSGYDETSLKP